jgi:hypothetical protein
LNAYPDASFLVSLFSEVAHSLRARKILLNRGFVLIYTSWQKIEVENARQLRVFRQENSTGTVLQALDQIQAEIDAGFLRSVEVPISPVLRRFFVCHESIRLP